MNTITLSNSFLQEKVKNDYSDHKIALVREFLQNSCDADSTRIDFKFDEEGRTLTVTDNGCGMDDKIMVNALFDIGGSYKEKVGSVGGFGSAKLILLFQHEKYTITSWRDGKRYEVSGQASTYSDIKSFDDSEGRGTVVKIHFLPSWAISSGYDSYNTFDYSSIAFLERCNVSPQVMWNNCVMFGPATGELSRTLDWCTVSSHKLESDTYHMSVRVGGIEMFKIYVGGIRNQITVDLTNSSINLLTTNRDGLRGGYSEELNELVKEININTTGLNSLNGKVFIYEGVNSSFFDTCKNAIISYKEKIISMLEMKLRKADSTDNKTSSSLISRQIEEFTDHIDNISKDETIKEMSSVVKDFHPTTAILGYIKAISDHKATKVLDGSYKEDYARVVTDVVETYSSLESKTSYDFIVNVDEEIKRIPRKYDPKLGMNQKYTKLAKLWKHSINLILASEEIDVKYKIGWHLNKDLKASYSMKNDIHTLLINPDKDVWFNGLNKTQRIKRVFRAACHEITHLMGHQYHDETFLLVWDRLRELEDGVANWVKFEQDAMLEII